MCERVSECERESVNECVRVKACEIESVSECECECEYV